MTTDFVPYWVHTKFNDRHYCNECQKFYTGRAWRWFAYPSTWTKEFCEDCAERLASEKV